MSPGTWGSEGDRVEQVIRKVDKAPQFIWNHLSLFFLLRVWGGGSDFEGIKIPQGVFNLSSLQGQVPHVAL